MYKPGLVQSRVRLPRTRRTPQALLVGLFTPHMSCFLPVIAPHAAMIGRLGKLSTMWFTHSMSVGSINQRLGD
jgi:hypothetical protein